MRGVTCRQLEHIVFFTISTHTPHARRDIFCNDVRRRYYPFQLTRLMRGVTTDRQSYLCFAQFQLTRLMRGVTGIYDR